VRLGLERRSPRPWYLEKVPGRNLHALAEQRSLDLHREVAARLRYDSSVIARARERVRSWRIACSVHDYYLSAWEEVLAREPSAIAGFLEEESEHARELRQVSPFAGVLDARTRWRIHRESLARWNRE
jgi:hypothetical protein